MKGIADHESRASSRRVRRLWSLAGCVAFVFCGASCGDEAQNGRGAGADGVDWYAIASNVFLPDGSVGHVVGTSRLTEQTLTLEDSVEIAGGGTVLSAGDGSILVGEFSSPRLTKYLVDELGQLEPVGRLSFLNLGLSNTGFFPSNVFFVDSDRAYVLSAESIIRINQTVLSIDREIPLPRLERDGFILGAGFTGFIRGDELFFTMQWNDFAGDRTLAEVALVAMDLNDETVEVSTLEGCGGAVWGAKASNGDIYWSNGAQDASIHLLSEGARAAPPCMVRLPAEEKELAEDIIDLRAQVSSGRPVGSLWGVGSGTAVIRILEDGFEVDEETTSGELTFRTDWSWYRFDLTTLEIERIQGLGENGGSVFIYELGGRYLAPSIPVTEDRTTLFDITDAERPIRSITLPGNVYSVVKAR